MKRISMAILTILSLSSLHGQEGSDTTDGDDPFGGYADSAKKLEEYSAAQKAKATRHLQDILIPAFNANVSNPNIRFLASSDHTIPGTDQRLLSIDTEEKAASVEALLKELKVSLKPSEETESEDWVQIRTPQLDAREAKVFILFPDLPKDDTTPFCGIRIYDRDGGVSELYFANRVVAADWVRLIGEFQAVTIKKRAEQAGTGQPATRSQSKSEGRDKPQPEAEGRSR